MADYEIYHFTHTDLDGVACSILSRFMYENIPAIKLFTTYCEYNEINSKVNELLDDLESQQQKKLRAILITDISVNAETAERLEKYRSAGGDRIVQLIDHHQLPPELTNYKWVNVRSDGSECGASLMYKQFFDEEDQNNALNDFIDNVRMYDLWQFDPDSLCKPVELNMLLYIFGKSYFEEMILYELHQHPFAVIDLDQGWAKSLLNEQYSKDNQYIEKKTALARDVEYRGLKGKYVFAEQNVSRLGNNILKIYPDADFAAVIQAPDRVSLRSRKDGVNVGMDIAKHFGGGGHPAAAGYTLAEPFVFTME